MLPMRIPGTPCGQCWSIWYGPPSAQNPPTSMTARIERKTSVSAHATPARLSPTPMVRRITPTGCHRARKHEGRTRGGLRAFRERALALRRLSRHARGRDVVDGRARERKVGLTAPELDVD